MTEYWFNERPLRSRTKMQLLNSPGHPSNNETGSRHAFEAKLGEHVSKICGDVLHFCLNGGSYVSESQCRKECSAKRSPASPTWAGGFQTHPAGGHRLETVPGIPTFCPPGRRSRSP